MPTDGEIFDDHDFHAGVTTDIIKLIIVAIGFFTIQGDNEKDPPTIKNEKIRKGKKDNNNYDTGILRRPAWVQQ